LPLLTGDDVRSLKLFLPKKVIDTFAIESETRSFGVQLESKRLRSR
jgi:hypothetical protein